MLARRQKPPDAGGLQAGPVDREVSCSEAVAPLPRKPGPPAREASDGGLAAVGACGVRHHTSERSLAPGTSRRRGGRQADVRARSRPYKAGRGKRKTDEPASLPFELFTQAQGCTTRPRVTRGWREPQAQTSRGVLYWPCGARGLRARHCLPARSPRAVVRVPSRRRRQHPDRSKPSQRGALPGPARRPHPSAQVTASAPSRVSEKQGRSPSISASRRSG